MKKLTGKVALVTGGSRGIGRGIALRLAQEGALVAVHYGKNQGAAEDVTWAIRKQGGTAFAVGADLMSGDGLSKLYAALDTALIEHTGRNRLDILVNNAGIGQTSSIEELTGELLDEAMNMNVKAPIFVIQHALRRMNDEGRIINISSAVTRIAFPNMLGYSVSKGAVNTLTRVLAHHLGDRKITVNAILPGLIETDMNAAILQSTEGQTFAAGLSVFGRWGQPEDVADVAVFLASPDSRWVTGQLIDASGGSHQ
ncbi:SDR family oxidoreductase [Paenibacillus tarimensis]